MRNEPIESRDLPSTQAGERERLMQQDAALASHAAQTPRPEARDMADAPVSPRSAVAGAKPGAARRKPRADDDKTDVAPDADGEEAGTDQAGVDEGSGQSVELAMLDAAGGAVEGAAQSDAGTGSGGEQGGKDGESGGGNDMLLYALGGLALVGGGVAAAAGGGGGKKSSGPAADTTPPAAPTIALTTDTGASTSDRITSNGAIAIGNLEAGATWEYSTNNGSSWTAGSGTSFTLPAGNYAAGAVQVRQKDGAGNVSAVASIAGAVVVDNAAPSAPAIGQVAGNDVVNTAEKAAGVTVSGTAEANSSVVVTWGATSKTVTADANGAWSAAFAATEVPANGASSITARATDAAGNASADGTRAITIADTIAVTGQVVAGPVIAGNNLSVDLYSGTGALLRSGIPLSANGTFSTTIDVLPGTVVVARVVDAADGADYLDEATAAPKDLNGQLLAVAVAQGATLTLNINPLTTIAAQEAGLQPNGTGTVTAAGAAAANAAVARAFGLGETDIVTTAVVPANTSAYDPANGLSSGERIGALLSALSGLDAKNGGNVQTTINDLVAAITVTGSVGALNDQGQQAMVDGAARADAAIGGNLQDAISNTVATGTATFSIASIGTDNVVNGSEAPGLTLSGTVAEGASAVTLTIGSTTVAATLSGTSWTYALTAEDRQALGEDGVKLIKAEATLAGGAKVTASRAFVLDVTGPAAPTLADVATDNKVNLTERTAGVTLTGTSEPGSAVQVTWGGASKSVIAGANGGWTATFASSEVPADGNTTVAVTASDSNGNVGGATTRDIFVDTLAATAPTIAAVAGNDVVGVVEAEAGVTVNGTAEAGATVQVVWGTVTKSVTADADGAWTASFQTAELPADGATRILVSQSDGVGNVSLAATREVRMSKAPTLPVFTAISGDDRVNLAEASDGVTVAGVAAPNSQITLNWGGVQRTTTTTPNGEWSATFGIADLPADGSATLSVTALTASGILIGSSTRQVTLDTTAPTSPTLATIGGNDVVNAAEKGAGVSVSGTGEAGATVEITWGSLKKSATVGGNGSWSIQVAAGEVPSDGTRNISVSQSDAAGNRSGSINRDIVIDTGIPDAPAVALLTDSGSSNSDGLTKTGTISVTGLNPGTTWEYSIDGGASWEPGSGTSFSLTENDYAIGDIRVRQTDAAGNVSAVASNAAAITVDQSAPDLGFDDISFDGVVNAAEKDAGVVVTGTSEPLSSVTVTWGGLSKLVQAAADGSWSARFEASEIPADGTGLISATAIDLAGNQLQFPVSTPVTIDTAAPAAPQLVLVSDTGTSGSDRITRAGTIGIAGLESDGEWQYSVDGGQTWSPGSETSFELAAGSYASGAVQARQIDAAGNVGAAVSLAHAVTVDTSASAPTIDPVGTDGIVNAPERSAGVTVTGRAEPFASVALTWGSATKVVTANANGGWTATFATADVPADGVTSIQAVQTDVAGNISEATSLPVTVDTVAPAAPAIALVTANGSVNAAEKAAGVTVAGTAAANAEVVVTWGGTEKTVRADGAGAWSAQFASSEVPADGTTTVTAYQINGIGNPSSTTPRTVIVDTVANAPVIDAVAGNNTVNAAERNAGVTVSGSAEAGSTVTIQWGTVTKTAVANGSGVWSTSFARAEVPGEGVKSLTASATDLVGNTSPIAEASITVDTVAPSTPVISAIATDDIVTAAERGAGVAVSGTAEAGASVRVTWGGASKDVTAAANGSWTANFAANELPTSGDFAVTAVATDPASNSSASASRIVAVSDAATNAPVIAAITTDNVVNLAEKTAGVRINGIAPPSSSVTIVWDTVSKTVTSTASGNWTVSFSSAEVPADGVRDVTATVNGVSTTRSVLIDSTAPDAPSLDPVAIDGIINDAEKLAGVTVSGDAGAGDTITVTWGSVTRTATANANGDWSTSFASNEVPADGAATLSARAADASGNIGGTATAQLTVDTVAPAAPTLGTIAGDNAVSAQERTENVAISGTGIAGADVSVTWQGITKTVEVQSDGAWSAIFTPSEIITSGTTLVSVVQRDEAGNASSVVTRSIEVGGVETASASLVVLGYDAGWPIGALDFDGFGATDGDISGLLASAGFGQSGASGAGPDAPIASIPPLDPMHQTWTGQPGGQTVI